MPLSFTVRIHSYRARWQGSRGELNKMFRAALLAAADLWIKEFLPQHFGNQATNRYGYAFRSRKWLAIKKHRRPDLIPPAPLEMTGVLRETVELTAKSGVMLERSKAISTSPSTKNPSGKLQVRIPVRIPHPLNPRNKGELTRIVRSEYRAMRREFFRVMEMQLRASPKYKTTETISPRAA